MTGQQRDIEWIVGEVMRRLIDVHAVAAKTETNRLTAREPSKPSAPKGDRHQLRIDHRVVTTAQLDGRLDGIRQVIVPVRAVVTPAVRDTLRKKRIAILSESATPERSETVPDRCTVTLAVVGPAAEFAAAVAAVSRELGDVKRVDNDCVIKAVRGVAEAVSAGPSTGVVLTRKPAVALCLANRQHGVRAAWAVDPAAVREATASIGANLLVVNPASHGIYELKVMAREFANGNHECPKRYIEALGS